MRGAAGRRWLAGLLVAFASAEASAYPVHRRLARETYAMVVPCELCHGHGGGTERNPYGLAWQEAGENQKAFARIERADTDGDGFANADEIRGGSNPGRADSTPQAPGGYAKASRATPIPTLQLELVLPEADRYEVAEPDVPPAGRAALQSALGRAPNVDEAYPTVYFSVRDGQRTAAALFGQGEWRGQHLSLLFGIGLDGRLSKVVMFRSGRESGAAYRPYLNCLVGKSKDEIPAAGSVPCPTAGDLSKRLPHELATLTDITRGALWTLWQLFAKT